VLFRNFGSFGEKFDTHIEDRYKTCNKIPNNLMARKAVQRKLKIKRSLRQSNLHVLIQANRSIMSQQASLVL
jgi:hypothetical protein